MNSLPRAGEILKGLNLLNIENEAFKTDSKIVCSILMTESYKHFISPLYHNINPAIENVTDQIKTEKRITLITEIDKPIEMNYYLFS